MKTKFRRRAWLLWAAVLGLVFFFSFAGEYNLYALWKLRAQTRELRAEIVENRQRQQELANQIERLESDSTYIEKVAREKFKMGRDGEKIYLIQGEGKR